VEDVGKNKEALAKEASNIKGEEVKNNQNEKYDEQGFLQMEGNPEDNEKKSND